MTRRFLVDALERVVATYVQSFLGLILASSLSALNVSTVRAAAVAAIPAALSAAKAIVARFTGDPDSAAVVSTGSGGAEPDPTPPVGLFHVEGPTGPLAPLPPAPPAPSAGDQLLTDLLEGGE